MKEYPLNVPTPRHCAFAVRDLPTVTVEQRERALKARTTTSLHSPPGC